MSRMKIVAGIGTLEDYIPFVEAGAEELFAGFVPGWFQSKYGRAVPLNRREVLYSNVQLGTESELMILGTMVRKIGVPVTIALNALSYPQGVYEDICAIVETCKRHGFIDFIVADPGLIRRLGQVEGIRLHISGELGELNHGVVEAVMRMAPNVKRFITPRQTSIGEILELISESYGKMISTIGECCGNGLEFEAFALNEKCHFTGAYCNSLHCDELCPMCRVPYRLAASQGSNTCEKVDPMLKMTTEPDDSAQEDSDLLGASGCGICSLWDLAQAGVTHLKVVSRGNFCDNTLRDIRAMRSALDILVRSGSKDEYIRDVKRVLFPDGCSGNCYFLSLKH